MASTPVVLTVERDGGSSASRCAPLRRSRRAPLVGFAYGTEQMDRSPGEAASEAGTAIWEVATGTAHVFTHLFESEQRKQISGVVGITDVAHQTIDSGERSLERRCCCSPWSASRSA